MPSWMGPEDIPKALRNSGKVGDVHADFGAKGSTRLYDIIEQAVTMAMLTSVAAKAWKDDLEENSTGLEG